MKELKKRCIAELKLFFGIDNPTDKQVAYYMLYVREGEVIKNVGE